MNCFVIMPFDAAFDDVYAHMKIAVHDVTAHQIRCRRLDDIQRPGKISEDLIHEIMNADFCIADLTGSNANVMWEVGYAQALGKRIIFVSQNLSTLPFDIRDMRTLLYDPGQLKSTLVDQLISVIPETLSADERNRNDVEDFFSHDDLAQHLIDGIPLPVFFKDSDGTYRGCNERFCRFLGRERERIVGKSVYDVALPQRAKVYEEQDNDLLANPGEQIYDSEVDGEDGRRNVRFLKGTFPVGSEPRGIVGVVLDTTELVRTQNELRESQERFKRLAEATGDGVAIHDGDKVLEANDTFCKLFGYSPEEIAGVPIATFVTAETWPAVREHIASQSEQSYEALGRKRNGGVFRFRVRAANTHLHGEWVRVAIVRPVNNSSDSMR